MLKVSVGFVHHFKIGECVIIACHNFLKIIELMLIHNADQHRFFIAGIGADRFDLGASMAQFFGDIFDQLVFVGGDDGEFIGGLGGLSNRFPTKVEIKQ